MLTFVNYLRTYFNSGFHWAPHLCAALFLALAISANYYWDFYNRVTEHYYKKPISVIFLFCFYAFAFLVATAIVSYFKKEKRPLFNRKYLLFVLIGIAFLSLDSSYYLMKFADSFLPVNPYLQDWINSLLSNLSSFITVIIPLYVVYFGVKHFKPEFYGMRLNGAKVLPYFWLILFMIPLMYLASFRPDFLETYPTYDDHFEYRFLNTEQWITAGLYELTYGFDFISVELFFRGFLVVALSRFVGKDALIPMVVVYAFLHFGKPAGEAISSIFGGYILGILAYQSRNIFGGLVAHLGVAWGMEYFAYLQG